MIPPLSRLAARAPIGLCLALGLALALLACDRDSSGRGPGADAPKTAGGDQARAQAPAQAAEPLPEMFPVTPFTFVDQAGAPLGLDELRGKVWVADFIFTLCPGMCKKLSARMGQIQKSLAAKPGWEDVRLISFSVDPDYDTPSVLAAYAKKQGADEGHWRFLTGTRAALWSFSQSGLKLAVGEPPAGHGEPIIHTSKMVLVDRDGRVRGYYDGLTDEGQAELERDVARALAEPRSPDVPFPAEVMSPPWLEGRIKAQWATADKIAAFHDFAFVDRLPESGITFRHGIVDDAGPNDKASHYDHGNGVPVADVDGDGRLDLVFVNQVGRTELWRNVGGGRFEDLTEASGLTLAGRIGSGASFADIDNDGDADLFVTTLRGGNLLFENDGKGKLTDITEKAGLGYVGHSSGAIFFDFDRDGLLDLFVCNIGRFTTDLQGRNGYFIGFVDAFAGHLKPERAEASILYKNMGGNVFRDVTVEQTLVETGWNGDGNAVDLNDDGFPDLYLTSMQGEDAYYENQGGKGFVKKTREHFPRTSWGAMGVKFFDYNADGLLDLFITDMHTDMAPPGLGPDHEKDKIPADQMYPADFRATDVELVYGNGAWENKGGGRFEEVSDKINFEMYWPWGLSEGDLNADGYPDVFIDGGMSYPFRYGMNTVFLNEGGKRFADAEFILGVEPRRGGRTARPWFELECGGADKGHQRCPAEAKGRVTIWSARSTRSAVIFDLDDDGDLDIVTSEFNDAPQVLVSDLADKKPIHFLKVRLVGVTSNRAGIGARVTVKAGGQARMQVNDGKSGYLSQSLMPLYFGLGDAESVEAIEVLWPSGKRQTVKGPIAGNTTVDVKEE